MASVGLVKRCKVACVRVVQLFREALLAENFQEIHTPKLIAGASEGGAAVFKLDYMGREGCLAQSPQFYKQMAVCSDMIRVFEIGPVFRCPAFCRQIAATSASGSLDFQACVPISNLLGPPGVELVKC